MTVFSTAYFPLIQYGDVKFGIYTANTTGYTLPTINYNINSIRTTPGAFLSQTENITLQGFCYGTGIASLLFLASGLKSRLEANNKKNSSLLIQYGTNILFTGIANVNKIEFSESSDNWLCKIGYNIDFSLHDDNNSGITGLITLATGNYITNAQDTYSLEILKDKTYIYDDTQDLQNDPHLNHPYKLSRTISATANSLNKSGALIYAKQWVQNREINFSMSGMFPRGSTIRLYNQERSINFDESAGQYSIQDSFIVKSGNPWLESFDVVTNVDDKGMRKIVINGTIEGLAPATGHYRFVLDNNHASGFRDLYPFANSGFDRSKYGPLIANPTTNDTQLLGNPTTHSPGAMKYANAVSGYHLLRYNDMFYNRAMVYDPNTIVIPSNITQIFSSNPINKIPTDITEGLDPFKGIITYSYTYNSRPGPKIDYALTENISYTKSFPVARTTSFQILGRKLGPIVYEYYNSSGLGEISITYNGVFPKLSGLKPYVFPIKIIRDIDDYLNGYAPDAANSYLTENKQNFNIIDSTISKTKIWKYKN